MELKTAIRQVGLSTIGIAGILLTLTILLASAADSRAELPIRMCVPGVAGKTVTSAGSKGTCAKEEATVELPETAELTTLRHILPDITYVASGIDGKPTIQWHNVNIQVDAGTKGPVNGEGNLVVGYDEGGRTQTGSDNLVVGEGQSFTSYGGLIAGAGNTITAPYGSVTGGSENEVSREGGSISGGSLNNVEASDASVSGGSENTAESNASSISGGDDNRTEAEGSSIGGGFGNYIEDPGDWSSIAGGHKNTVSGELAAILGGNEQTVGTRYGLYP